MATILAQLSTSADVIVIDSPPLLLVTDATVLAAKCDGVILVAAANETPRGAVERSKIILEGAGARMLGVVVNKSRKATGGYYHYGAYYGENAHGIVGRRDGGVRSAPISRIEALGNRQLHGGDAPVGT
jgi:Mrp family chromosome partitioning ATPase